MKINGLDQFDDFGDEKIFWFSMLDVPQSIIEKAREIDGEDYSDGCFGICVGYSHDKDEFSLSPDEAGATIYYVDNNGNKKWYQAEIPDELLSLLFEQSRKAMLEKTNKS